MAEKHQKGRPRAVFLMFYVVALVGLNPGSAYGRRCRFVGLFGRDAYFRTSFTASLGTICSWKV